MPISKTIIVPGAIAAAAVIGGVGGTLLNTAAANAATTSATASPSTQASPAPTDQPDQSKGGHTANGITEALLTGDVKTKAVAAAEAAVPGATVRRAENDAEGATYEVHMTKTDGSEVTVKLDASFKVTGTESGMGAPPSGTTSG